MSGQKAEVSQLESDLLVCPLSVLSNWEKQLRDHVAPGQLTMYTYHGASKGVSANTLKEYDVSS